MASRHLVAQGRRGARRRRCRAAEASALARLPRPARADAVAVAPGRRARIVARRSRRPPCRTPAISTSEFEPRRLAPWMPTLEHSPAAYRPASGVAQRDVGEDAAHRVVHGRADRDRLLHRRRRRRRSSAASVISGSRSWIFFAPRWRRSRCTAGPCGVAIVRPFCVLVPEGLRQAVARPELHRLGARPGIDAARGRSPADSGSRPC